jgi:catechol 2,3-dioxygenase-like lactoylglutathione lyase family enzyme
MARIVHIAVKVDDLEKATEFYEKSLGFVEVDDMKESAAELAKYGCEIISAPGVIPIKFRAPGGTLAEISPKARYKQTKD